MCLSLQNNNNNVLGKFRVIKIASKFIRASNNYLTIRDLTKEYSSLLLLSHFTLPNIAR
jgi:hypothetical protein